LIQPLKNIFTETAVKVIKETCYDNEVVFSGYEVDETVLMMECGGIFHSFYYFNYLLSVSSFFFGGGGGSGGRRSSILPFYRYV